MPLQTLLFSTRLQSAVWCHFLAMYFTTKLGHNTKKKVRTKNTIQANKEHSRK